MQNNALIFNNYCKSHVWNLRETIKQILESENYEISLKYVAKILSDSNSELLISLLEDICPYIENIKLQDEDDPESYLEADNINIVAIVDIINNNYGMRVDIAQGDARLALIFENFVIKFDKSYYSSQTDDEISEYYTSILSALEKKTTEIHDLLPIISIIDLNDITFEIFPVAEPLNTDDITDEWLKLQSSLRYNLIGDGIEQDSHDLYSSNLGYYDNKLYIIDAGSITSLNEECAVRNYY